MLWDQLNRIKECGKFLVVRRRHLLVVFSIGAVIGLLLLGLFRGNVTFANSAGSWNPQRSQFLLTMLMVSFFTCLLNASNQPI